MALGSGKIQHHTPQCEIGVELPATEHDDRRATCRAGDVDDQEDGRAQQLGNLRRGAPFVMPAAAVEETHDPFDHRDIGVPAGAHESL